MSTKKTTTKKVSEEKITQPTNPNIEITMPKVATFVIKATIPTGSYANIQPELTFNDVSLVEINKLIMPQIDAMFVKYHNYNEKVANFVKQQENQAKAYAQAQADKAYAQAKANKEIFDSFIGETPEVENKETESVTFKKITDALDKADIETKKILIEKVKISEKLTEEEKETIINKYK
jgi:hypothetical protein